MYLKILATVLALLVANPLCCCQDLGFLLGIEEAPASCGCEGGSPDAPSEEQPCSTCLSTIEKRSADGVLDIPRPQGEEGEIALRSHSFPLKDFCSSLDGIGHFETPLPRTPSGRLLCQVYCLYLL